MAISLKIKNRWGYILAFILLLISYFLIFYIISKLTKESNAVSQSYSIINNLESLKAELTDAETGVSGYLISNDVRFLKPYNSGSKQISFLYDQLRVLINNKNDKPKLDSLGFLIDEQLARLSASVVLFQRRGFILTPDMIESLESNKNSMSYIRNIISELKSQQVMLMNLRYSKLKGFFQSTSIIAILSLIIALVTSFYSLITYNKESIAKEEADKNARLYSMELEDRVNELNKVNIELEDLRRIEKFAATGRIARIIAHEVRNPLTNISLATEQLKEIDDQNEETDLLLTMIGRNVTRINQLVSDLLNATRIDQLEYSLVNINTLLNEALEQAQDRLELNRITVKKYYDTSICDLWVDKGKVKLAFLNIIVNAIEAMQKDSGVLELKTYKQADKCIIEFKDNGTGMDNETIQKVFEPYFTAKAKGSGLGLANAQNIILNHKGSIHVQSQPGKGSSFFIILNLADNK